MKFLNKYLKIDLIVFIFISVIFLFFFIILIYVLCNIYFIKNTGELYFYVKYSYKLNNKFLINYSNFFLLLVITLFGGIVMYSQNSFIEYSAMAL